MTTVTKKRKLSNIFKNIVILFSSLLQVLPDHLNAEIVAGTITTKQEALDYMTWTYFFRRLVQNPTYYGLEGVDETNINVYLTRIVDQALNTLHK